MARSRGETIPLVELLGLGPTRTAVGGIPAVLITIRPEPRRNWRASSFAVTKDQAERLRDDLTALLQQMGSAKEPRGKAGHEGR